MSKFSENVIFSDVLDAISSIENFTQNIETVQEFVENDMCFTAVLHKIQIIGEALNRFPKENQEKHPQIEWVNIIRSRHILAHHYDNIDPEIIWRIKAYHLPILKEQILQILE